MKRRERVPRREVKLLKDSAFQGRYSIAVQNRYEAFTERIVEMIVEEMFTENIGRKRGRLYQGKNVEEGEIGNRRNIKMRDSQMMYERVQCQI